MAKPRDYAAEYRRRIERQMAKGYTRAQARGHPGKADTLISALTGRPLRGAARRGAERRQARERMLAPPGPAVRWQRVPGEGGGLYTHAGTEGATLAAVEQAARQNRKLIVHIHADEVIYDYPDPRLPNVATLRDIPAGFVLEYMQSQNAGVWAALTQLAVLKRGQGYQAIIGVRSVEIKSYPM